MCILPTGENITIHLSKDELDLLKETTPHRKKNYFTMPGSAKQRMHQELKIRCNQIKIIQIDDTTYSMLNDLTKKHSQKSNQIIENIVNNL